MGKADEPRSVRAHQRLWRRLCDNVHRFFHPVSNYRMQFYTRHNGIQMTLVWPNEREFRLGQQFLQDIAGGPTSAEKYHPDDPDFYYLTTEAQYDALLEFRRKLRNGEL